MLTQESAPGRQRPSVAREGITVVAGNPESIVDIVLLHGLNGHPEETWTHQSRFFWPWELRTHVKDARVMVFGYNADATQAVADNLIRIKGVAQRLLSDLVVERQEENERNRPIIFMGHSLGGLVVKKAILLASQELHNTSSDRRLIYSSTRGLFFFATPHLGSEVGGARRVKVLKGIAKVAFTKVPRKLDAALRLHSDELGDLNDDFRRTSIWLDEKLDIYTYFETMTHAAIGKLVVDETSSRAGYNMEISAPIQAGHQDMVKFSNENDGTFRSICANIKASIRREMHQTPGGTSKHDFRVPSYPPCSMNPVKAFTERNALLDEVRRQLTGGPESSHLGSKSVGIWGLGGVGKSQLARAYLQKYGSQYDATFWIQAAGVASLDQDFRQIYASLPIQERLPPDATADNIRLAVLTWWTLHPGKWLCIFDEADHLDRKDEAFVPIASYIPRGGNVHVIITSRSPLARELSTHEGLEVRVLEPKEGVELFLKYAKIENATEETQAQAELIEHQLGYLPLALSIAGAFVSRTPGRAANLSSYLHEHQEQLELLQREPQPLVHMYERSLLATWEISYLGLQKRCPDAARIFSMLSFLAIENIHPDIFLLEETPPLPQASKMHVPCGEDFENDGEASRQDGCKPVLDPAENLSMEISNIAGEQVDPGVVSNHWAYQPWQVLAGLQSSKFEDIEECFALMEQFSLLQRNADGTYFLHRLVQTWSHHRLQTQQAKDFYRYGMAVFRIFLAGIDRLELILRRKGRAAANNDKAALRLVSHLRNGLKHVRFVLEKPDHIALLAVGRIGTFLLDLLAIRESASFMEMFMSMAEKDCGRLGNYIFLTLASYGGCLSRFDPGKGAIVLAAAAQRAQTAKDHEFMRSIADMPEFVFVFEDFDKLQKCVRLGLETLLSFMGFYSEEITLLDQSMALQRDLIESGSSFRDQRSILARKHMLATTLSLRSKIAKTHAIGTEWIQAQYKRLHDIELKDDGFYQFGSTLCAINAELVELKSMSLQVLRARARLVEINMIIIKHHSEIEGLKAQIEAEDAKSKSWRRVKKIFRR